VETSIPLSNSVAVTVPSPHQLQLVYGLEDVYRPRYKSDYFPQTGKVRHPRYVADKYGNHYVTLKMPQGSYTELSNVFVRVAWITTNIENQGHFYSPYKFQVDNEEKSVPDVNPMYSSVKNALQDDRTIKLHLVLIKSKLDVLNNVQGLIPFSDISTNSLTIKSKALTPKQLLSKYQLEKSQLAFTLCTKLRDGTFKIHPETTVISSVMTELGTKSCTSTIRPSKEDMLAMPSSTTLMVQCPKCAHCFESAEATKATDTNKQKPEKSLPSVANKRHALENRMGKKKKKKP
jgi:hypothetical protein